jgi:hypothetical protein
MSPGEQLLARLGLDTSGFKANLKDAHSTYEKFAKTVGVGLSVAGIAAYSRSLIEYGTRVYDLGQRFGVSTSALQKFGNAAEENGSSLEGVARAFNKLDIAKSRSLGGNAAIIANFKALGITVEDLRNLTPEEIMAKIGKSSMNAADMVKVLGKSALELRPTLAGLADGTIEFGEAIDSAMIQKLKEADKFWRQTWNNIRVVAASALGQIFAEVKFLTTSVAGMFSSMRAATVAEFLAMKAAATGNFTEMKRQAEIAVKAVREFKHFAFDDLSDKPAPGAAGPGRFAPTGDGTVKKSKSELDAEKKDRARDQLSLKDLAEKGPGFAYRNPDGLTYSQVTGTAQMIYAAQQARLVESLEAQARRVRLSGISPTGETSAQLLSRADAIRQTLPIKESEKEVGIYRQAFKDALQEPTQLLSEIRDELE